MIPKLSRRDLRTLPRSGYTEQPRASALGRGFSGGRWKGGVASPRSAVRGAARVLRPSNENTSGDLARFSGARGRAPSPNCTRVAGWRCFQGGPHYGNPGLKPWAVLYSRFATKPRGYTDVDPTEPFSYEIMLSQNAAISGCGRSSVEAVCGTNSVPRKNG